MPGGSGDAARDHPREWQRRDRATMVPPIAQDRQLMEHRFRAPGAAVAILAAGAIAEALLDDGFRLLHYACKPLATVLIAVYAMRAAPPVSARYRAAV